MNTPTFTLTIMNTTIVMSTLTGIRSTLMNTAMPTGMSIRTSTGIPTIIPEAPPATRTNTQAITEPTIMRTRVMRRNSTAMAIDGMTALFGAAVARSHRTTAEKTGNFRRSGDEPRN